MKRLLSVLFLCVAIFAASVSWAAVGTCTQTLSTVLTDNGPSPVAKILTFTCTGGTGAETGTYPATAISTANTNDLKSWYLYKVETNPGAIPPEDNWDFTITNANGIDMMGGAGANRHTTTSQRVKPVYVDPLVGTWTVNITGNTTASAIVVLDLTFLR